MYGKKLFMKLFLIIITIISLIYMFNQYNSVIKLTLNRTKSNSSFLEENTTKGKNQLPDKIKESNYYRDLFPVKGNNAHEVFDNKALNISRYHVINNYLADS